MKAQAFFLLVALRAAQESTEGEQGYDLHPGSVSERAELYRTVCTVAQGALKQPVTFIAFIAPSKKIPTLIMVEVFFLFFFNLSRCGLHAALAILFPPGLSHLLAMWFCILVTKASCILITGR